MTQHTVHKGAELRNAKVARLREWGVKVRSDATDAEIDREYSAVIRESTTRGDGQRVVRTTEAIRMDSARDRPLAYAEIGSYRPRTSGRHDADDVEAATEPVAESTCSECGAEVSGKFCAECGAKVARADGSLDPLERVEAANREWHARADSRITIRKRGNPDNAWRGSW